MTMKKSLCLWMVLVLSLTFVLASCGEKSDLGRICYQSNGDGTCGVGRFVKDPEEGLMFNVIYMLFARFTADVTFDERLNSDITEYVIPETSKKGDTVTAVGQYGFEDWVELEGVVIHGKVTKIERSAFSGCTSLKKVDMAFGVTTIGDYAFSECKSLEKIELPNSVTSIGSSAFEGCSKLQYIEIPASVTSIGANAFNNCSGQVYYLGTLEQWRAMEIGAGNEILNTAIIPNP